MSLEGKKDIYCEYGFLFLFCFLNQPMLLQESQLALLLASCENSTHLTSYIVKCYRKHLLCVFCNKLH